MPIQIYQLPPSNSADVTDSYPIQDSSNVTLKVTGQQILEMASANGFVTGPSGAIDDEILVSDGGTGSFLKQSGLLIKTSTPVFYNSQVLFMDSSGQGITVDSNGNFSYNQATTSFQFGSNNASGQNSACIGGLATNATATNSACIGGINSVISSGANQAVAIGNNQLINASGINGFAGGEGCIVSGQDSFAFGNTCSTTGDYAFSIGSNATAAANTFSANFSTGYVLSGGPVTVSSLNQSAIEITSTSQSLSVGNIYIANNASIVTLTLPSTATIGSIIEIIGKGAGGWKIAQNAGQSIHLGNVTTTTGVGGSLSSTNRYDSLILKCITADNEWTVRSPIGSITYI